MKGRGLRPPSQGEGERREQERLEREKRRMASLRTLELMAELDELEEEG